MRLRLLVVAVFVASALVVPTAAVTSGEDESAVALSPHEGPNGDYATVEDGELRVDFDRLNDEARTTAHDVVEVTSRADEPIEVWVEVDEEAVTAYEGDDPDAALDRGNPVELQPGETLAVGFRVDTRGDSPESGTVTVGVRSADDDGDAGSGSGSGSDDGSGESDGSDGSLPGGTPASTPTPSGPDVVDAAVGVEVDFEGEADPDAVTVRRLETLPADDRDAPPRAAVDRGRALPGPEDDGLAVHGGTLVAQQGDTLRLTGVRSSVGPVEAVASEPRTPAIVEVSAPPALRDRSATLRFRVERGALEGAGAAEARVGRHTADGWQVLPTRVVETDAETVLLEARTPGAGTFVVFAESGVDYEWTLPDGRTVSGEGLRTSFEEAGARNVTLTVTDALGRSDSARERVLVNDRPSVTIEQVPADGGDRTLRANVTDEYGDVTVTWALPEGSTATGETVTGSFEAGDAIAVTVEDEYGAVGTESAVVTPVLVGESGLEHLPLSLPLWGRLLLAVAAVAVAVAAARSSTGARVADGAVAIAKTGVAPLVDDSPRVTAFEDPRWNPRERRVEIERLEVVAPGGTLRRVELTVTDPEGRAVVTRTVDVDAGASYSANPEYVPVYGGLELSDAGGYGVEVRAVDEHDRVGSADVDRSRWGSADPAR